MRGEQGARGGGFGGEFGAQEGELGGGEGGGGKGGGGAHYWCRWGGVVGTGLDGGGAGVAGMRCCMCVDEGEAVDLYCLVTTEAVEDGSDLGEDWVLKEDKGDVLIE